jgi:uncharacterized protein (DUF488 family)
MAEGNEIRPIHTIGHSTRPIEAFVDLLRTGGVQLLIDVRSIPRSRTNPQYNLETLPETLSAWQIGHRIIPELGGRRSRQKQVPPEVNGYWTNQSFHNYADYALSDEFRSGLEQLIGLAAEQPSAIMCSEAVWWRCHRRIIADHLLARGLEVLHLMGSGRIERASTTPGAELRNGQVTYPSDKS